MSKRGGRRAVTTVGVVVASSAVVVYLLLLLTKHPGVLDRGDKLSSVGGLILGVSVAAYTWWANRRPPVFEEQRLLIEAEKELALSVARQWDAEAAIRGLIEPAPLQTRWKSSAEAVAAPAAEILGREWLAGRPTRLKLHGTVDDVADALRRLPAHQLVVIGPPGSGKTSIAVLLVRHLIRTSTPVEPTPVLLSLTTWQPHEQQFETWLEVAISRQHPAVADAKRFGPDAVLHLHSAGRILPVLDGLDEMPHESRRRAIIALNNYLTKPRSLVLTCRSVEYEEVIKQVGSPLARAAVVELAKISSREAADYLTAGQGSGSERRWEPVVSHLRSCPEGALAETLSTPLMVYLARTAYRPPGIDPAELLTFTDASKLQEHLLAAFIPAIYDPRFQGAKPCRYSAADSRTWLAFLARHLVSSNRREISWWRLIDAVQYYRTINLVAVVALCIILTFPTATMISGMSAGIGFSVLATLLIGLPLGLVSTLSEGAPHRIKIAPRKLLDGFAAGAAMAVVALPLSIFAGFSDSSGLAAGIGTSALVQLSLSIGLGLLFGAVVMLTEGISGPDIGDHVADPRRLLIRDRQTLVAGTASAFLMCFLIMHAGCTVVGLFLGGQTLGTTDALGISLIFGTILGPVVGMASGAGSAWLRLQQARLLLAPRGRLPWTVVDFLDDAHRRGVLRKNGAEYQFRHIRLQEFLAHASKD